MADRIGELAEKIVSPWAWWQKALANPSEIGKPDLPVHEGHPQQGYYRAKNRDKVFDPVAIYYPEEASELVAFRNGREVRPDEIWTFCCRYPVSYEAYIDAIDGKGWPDDDAVVAKQVAPTPPGIGDNSGDVSEAEALKDQIEAALRGVDGYSDIASDEVAAKALSLRNRLNELSGDADKKREALKRPHLDAGKSIDKEWQPLVKSAKSGADKVKASIEAWETKKLQAARKAEQEAAEAERLRIEEERAANPPESANSGDIDMFATVDAKTEERTPAPKYDPSSATVRPTYGRAAAVKEIKVVTDVTDYAALAMYMIGHAELKELLFKLAQRAVDAGRTDVPGITIEERATIR